AKDTTIRVDTKFCCGMVPIWRLPILSQQMHSSKEHIGMAGPWGYKLSTIAIAWGRVTLILTLVFAYTHSLSAQDIPMTMQAVLAHNDYQKPDPFHHACEHRVGVMEADLYYDEGRIIVAHVPSEPEFKKDL